MPELPFDTDAVLKAIMLANQRKAKALAEYQAAVDELEWWRHGAELFGIDISADMGVDPAQITELFPPASFFVDGTKPTLRQAIVALMRETPATALSITAIARALASRKWLPDRDDAQKRVSDMAGLMYKDGQLERIDRGEYRLAPQLAVAFEERPVTDYRQAAAMGFPVPEQLPGPDEDGP